MGAYAQAEDKHREGSIGMISKNHNWKTTGINWSDTPFNSSAGMQQKQTAEPVSTEQMQEEKWGNGA